MTYAEPLREFDLLYRAAQGEFRCGRVGSAERLLAAAAAVPCLGHRFVAYRGLGICLQLSQELHNAADCFWISLLHEAANGMFDRIPLTARHLGYSVLALVFVARQVPEDRYLRSNALSLQMFHKHWRRYRRQLRTRGSLPAVWRSPAREVLTEEVLRLALGPQPVPNLPLRLDPDLTRILGAAHFKLRLGTTVQSLEEAESRLRLRERLLTVEYGSPEFRHLIAASAQNLDDASEDHPTS